MITFALRLFNKRFRRIKHEIIIYVSGVDADSGRYEVISKFTNISNEEVHFSDGRVND